MKGELAENPSVTFLFKEEQVDGDCPLGKGVRLAFKRTAAQAKSGRTEGEIDIHGVAGIYELEDSGGSKVYTRIGGGVDAKIAQHFSGCGWVVKMDGWWARRLRSTCEDDTKA